MNWYRNNFSRDQVVCSYAQITKTEKRLLEMAEPKQKSWYARTFGRSIFSIIFGKFFEVKNNTAGIVATSLVLTLCFVVVYKVDAVTNLDKILEGVLNVIFVVVGYYFGAKQAAISNDDEE